MHRHLLLSLAACALVSLFSPAVGQILEGELRVEVRDPAGLPISGATAIIESRNPQFRAQAKSDAGGLAQLTRLPLGSYLLQVESSGLQPSVQQVEIRSAVPITLPVKLAVKSLATEVTVRDEPPLLDVLQPSYITNAGSGQLRDALATTLGRSVIDVVTTMPGWLLEANAVLHPRGSEYDTQYVIDGMPLYDNRSLAFAPAFENTEFESVNVLTSGIPAEYGRRLGGVIALDSRRVASPGSTTEVHLQGGSYGTGIGAISQQLRIRSTSLFASAHGGFTDRYLDPPSLENFTNRASSSGVNLRLDQELSGRDRLAVYFRANRTGFLVPNDLVQQAAGQRQDRSTRETAGQIHYQRVFNSSTLASIRGMVRDLDARLWSNPLSTPVYVNQDRGFREGAVIGAVTFQSERHTLKTGGDLRINSIRERFRVAEPDELPELDLDFNDRKRSTEASFFVQDHLRWGNFALMAGLRFDHYDLLISDQAFSPRIALSYYFPGPQLMLRASYDRVFQPPPTENLLLSSAAARLGIDEVEDVVPVPASRANFFEVGLSKPLFGNLRLDVNHYWRTFRNYIDDDVFLNTGLSFPITFDTARIQGTEVRLELPRWRSLSSFVSYSNMKGTATSPVTGGLFIEGGEADELRDTVERFPISQDQRNTLAAQVRFEPHRRVWFSTGIRYGSGLPVELEDDDDDEEEEEDEDEDEDDDDDEQPIAQAILDRVNFERGRIRPNFSLDLSAGVRAWERDGRSLTLQVDARNITDRLNVINFSGLFSGTALAPGRQVSAQLRFRF
jgi:hypothetical protein